MRIAFCVYGIDEAALQRVEFYRQDWEALQALGHEVVFARKPGDLHGHFDAAVVWWWNYLWLWGPWLRARGVPILTLGVFDDYLPLSWPKRALKHWGCRFGALHAVLSQHEVERVAGRPLPAKGLRCCPLTIDTDFFRPGAEREASGALTLVNIAWQTQGNMRRKMVPELLEAFAAVAPQFPSARLILAGRPEDGGPELQRLARELGVAARVEFPGEISREEKLRLLQQCTLYCQVSRYEGFGLATAEALACAAPVLVSRVGAVEEVIQQDGTYVEELSVEGIRRGLEHCLGNLADCRRRAQAGAERLRRELGHERRRRDLAALLAELMAVSGKGGQAVRG